MDATTYAALACRADVPFELFEERPTIESHHAFTRQSIDTIGQLADRVAERHGANHPVVLALRDRFATIGGELVAELEAQERGSLLAHDASKLAALRALTGNYALPSDACLSFRALYERLDALERELHEHIALENEVRS